MAVPLGVHVSLMGNLVVALLPPVTTHSFTPPPPAVGPPFVPSFDLPVPVMWPPGFAMQQNKLTTTVLHRFQFIMLDGHDCGYMIPHITIPAANLQLPLIIMFSSRKTVYAASKVKANGTPIACSQLLPLPVPMMTCWSPVSMPAALPPLNVLNNVIVGMTWQDFLAGVIAIGMSMLGDWLSRYLSQTKGPLQGLFKNLFKGFGDVGGGLLGKLVGASNIGPFVLKSVLGAIAGGAKILLTGEGSIKVTVGSGYAGGQVSYGRTAEGANQYGIQGQTGGPLLSGSAAHQHTKNPDGSTSDKVTETAGTPVMQLSNQTKTDADPSGHTTKTTKTTTETGGAALPLESGAAATHQHQTTEKPAKAPATTDSTFSGVGSPFGSASKAWGPSL